MGGAPLGGGAGTLKDPRLDPPWALVELLKEFPLIPPRNEPFSEPCVELRLDRNEELRVDTPTSRERSVGLCYAMVMCVMQ